MAYTPPTGDAVAFVFSTAYTPPVGDDIDFVFGDAAPAYSETVAEMLSTLDAAGLFSELIETLLSSIGLVDTTSGGSELYNALAELYAIEDVAAGQVATSDQAAESVSFQDAVVSIVTQLLADVLQCGDNTTSLLSAISAVHDTLNSVDVNNSRVITGDSVSDLLDADDTTVSRIITAALGVIEALAVADSYNTTRATLATVADLFLLNLITNTTGPLGVSVAELLSAADGYATRIVGVNTTNEVLHGVDAAYDGAVVGNVIVTLLQLTATLATYANLSTVVNDPVTAADEATSNADTKNIIAIDVLLSDVSTIRGVGTNSLLSDIMVAAEVVNTGIAGYNSVVDIITILDAAELLFGLSPYDIINLILSLARGLEIDKAIVTDMLADLHTGRTAELGNVTLDQTTTRGVEL